MTLLIQLKPRTAYQKYRAQCLKALDAAIVEAVESDCDTEAEDTRQTLEHFGGGYVEGGVSKSVIGATIEVELEDDALRGYLQSRDEFFSGEFDGCGWTANVQRWIRKGRSVTVVLDVEPL